MLALGWLMLLPVMAAAAPEGAQLGWSDWLKQDFYHAAIVPLLVATIMLAYIARPSTSDEFPSGFTAFRRNFLLVWAFCVAADWLQGPYVYALYAAYGFSSAEIAQLFVAGFGSSLIFGCVVGTVTDTWGRKRTCIAYCALYILSCITKHFKEYHMLMIGRLTGGVATSMLFSCFECWMVSEHTQRHRFSGGLLGYMFGLMFTVMYFAAILSGLAGQFVADSFTFAPIATDSLVYFGGFCAPFDLSILCLVIGLMIMLPMWPENYGSKESDQTSLMDNLKMGASILQTDLRTLLVGVIVSCFEGSMFAFVFNWTPALASEKVPPPHGVIFALFMMACMCGASTATLTSDILTPSQRLVVTFICGLVSFMIASLATLNPEGNLQLSLFAFLLFEFCVGLYFPTIGVLKSQIVPEKVRGTVYNLYRMPLNGIVVGLLLSNISMGTCFKLNAVLLFIALLSMVALMKISAEEVLPNNSDEEEVEGAEMVGLKHDVDTENMADSVDPQLVGRADRDRPELEV